MEPSEPPSPAAPVHSASELLPVVYDELRRQARRYLRGERAGHTLNTTALVHEAYLRLVGLDRIRWQNRTHFLALATQAMRQILLNYARDRRALKRGGGERPATLDEEHLLTAAQADHLLAVDEALERLKQLSERQYRIVECRFFGGLSIEETAEVTGLSPATVKRDWNLARAWLNRELT
jgi:RNA polymerase sigma-70 factor (ECF subfamily)